MLNLAEEWIAFIPAPSTWPNAEVYSGLAASAKIAAKRRSRRRGRAVGRRRRPAAGEVLAMAYDAGKGRLIPWPDPPGSVHRPGLPQGREPQRAHAGRPRGLGHADHPELEVFGRNQGIIAVVRPRFESTHAEIMRDLENPDHSIIRFARNAPEPARSGGELDCWPINTAWAAQDEWLLGRTTLPGGTSCRHREQGQGGPCRGELLPAGELDRKGVPDKP